MERAGNWSREPRAQMGFLSWNAGTATSRRRQSEIQVVPCPGRGLFYDYAHAGGVAVYAPASGFLHLPALQWTWLMSRKRCERESKPMRTNRPMAALMGLE